MRWPDFLLNEKIEAPAICWTGASSCHVVDVGGDGELTTRSLPYQRSHPRRGSGIS